MREGGGVQDQQRGDLDRTTYRTSTHMALTPVWFSSDEAALDSNVDSEHELLIMEPVSEQVCVTCAALVSESI